MMDRYSGYIEIVPISGKAVENFETELTKASVEYKKVYLNGKNYSFII